MRIGIFGDIQDPLSRAVAQAAQGLGVEVAIIPANALELGTPYSFRDDQVFVGDHSLDDIRAFYVRYIPAPFAPAMQKDDQLVLLEDWHIRFMQSRERAHFYMSWLMQLEHDGAAVVNPPQAGSMLQYKPFQLHVLRRLGADVPRTLVTNDPAQARAFHAEVKDVIYKPIVGGALTRSLDAEALERLDAIRASPVVFQERVPGDDVRVTIVGDRVVSCVAIETPEQALDYRDHEAYKAGEAVYREIQLPEKVLDQCRQAMRGCNLTFAGIDIKASKDRYSFLELNSSPVYLEVEHKTGHPISRALAEHLIARARAAPTPPQR